MMHEQISHIHCPALPTAGRRSLRKAVRLPTDGQIRDPMNCLSGEGCVQTTSLAERGGAGASWHCLGQEVASEELLVLL